MTKEHIKKEVDKLPENLLDEVYRMLKRVVEGKKEKRISITVHDFKGQFDNLIIRKEAYE